VEETRGFNQNMAMQEQLVGGSPNDGDDDDMNNDDPLSLNFDLSNAHADLSQNALSRYDAIPRGFHYTGDMTTNTPNIPSDYAAAAAAMMAPPPMYGLNDYLLPDEANFMF